LFEMMETGCVEGSEVVQLHLSCISIVHGLQ
jgi:hypothetical protein